MRRTPPHRDGRPLDTGAPPPRLAGARIALPPRDRPAEASIARSPLEGPQPPTPAVRPRFGPLVGSPPPPTQIDLGTMAVVDLTEPPFELVAIGAGYPAGTAASSVGGDLPSGVRSIDAQASAGESTGRGDEESWEAFDLPKTTRELVSAADATASRSFEWPPNDADEVSEEPAGELWPEIRFYVGSAALFFVAFILTTAFFVIAPTVFLGWEPTAITSGSMEPAIRSGDVVVGNPNIPDDLGPGSVVTFDANTGMSITHRVVGVDADGKLITRGDANPEPDRSAVGLDEVRAVGRILVPYAGYPSVWAQDGAGWAVLFVGLVAGWLAWASRWAMFDRYNPWAAVEHPIPEAAR